MILRPGDPKAKIHDKIVYLPYVCVRALIFPKLRVFTIETQTSQIALSLTRSFDLRTRNVYM